MPQFKVTITNSSLPQYPTSYTVKPLNGRLADAMAIHIIKVQGAFVGLGLKTHIGWTKGSVMLLLIITFSDGSTLEYKAEEVGNG